MNTRSVNMFMRRERHMVAAVCSTAVILSLATVATAALPFIETFENRTSGDLMSVGQNYWSVSPINRAVVQSTQKFGGTNGASLFNGRMSKTFSSAGNVWVDVCLKPPRRLLTNDPPVASATAAAFYIDTHGYVVARSNDTWVTFTNIVTSTNDWIRLTANLDYSQHKWSLYACTGTASRLAITLATNLAFNYNASAFSLIRITATNNNNIGYFDNLTVAENSASGRPLCVDADQDGVADKWEISYLGGTAPSATADTDGDGWNNRQEYLGGTDPANASSYMHMESDVETPTSYDMAVRVFGGTHNATSIYAADSFNRTYAILVAANNPTNTKVLATNLLDGLSGINMWTNIAAASTYSSLYYNVVATYGGVTYTNTEEWAMYAQARAANQKYLVCVPVSLADTNSRFDTAIGQQLGRGLSPNTSGGNYGDADDRLDYIVPGSGNNGFRTLYWVGYQGVTSWWDKDSIPAGWATNQITPGMAFWIVRKANTANRNNTVFSGKSFTTQTVADIQFTTNYGGWAMFGWPLAVSKVSNGTTTNQLGFESIGLGGTTSDRYQTNKVGDQIWVWRNNTWRSYWLMDDHTENTASLAWNHKWWDDIAGTFANFKLEAGKGYYYRHVTNFTSGAGTYTGTNFNWRPQ